MQIIEPGHGVDITLGSVQTIGFFDGVHRGHRYLLEQVRDEAARRGLRSMVITFREHPRKVLYPGERMPLLTTLDEKLGLIAACGIDCAVVLDFTLEMSQMTASAFMEHVLVGQLGGQVLVIGYDHRFGKKSAEGFDDYVRYGERLGMHVVQARELPVTAESLVSSAENAAPLHVSSTAVRKALLRGDVMTARQILGRPYTFGGTVEHGESIGRTIGFPTANVRLSHPDKLIPGDGVYAVRATLGDRCLRGMLYIGSRPTLEGLSQHRIEVYLLDFDEEIYGQAITLELLAIVRSEQKFPSMESLKKQLEHDLQEVRSMTL